MEAGVGVVDKHAVVGVEEAAQDDLEELLLHAALVDAVLPQELHPQPLAQLLRVLGRNGSELP